MAKVDITPDEVSGYEVVGHRRKVTGVRDPLRAGVLVLTDGETKAAIVTLDTINAWNEMVKLARQWAAQAHRAPLDIRGTAAAWHGQTRMKNSS